MTIEFKEEQIVLREERTREPYVGYFTPNGKLIDYNILLGGNYHDAWQNPVSWAFLSYVSYIIKGTSIEKLKELENKFDNELNEYEEFPRMVVLNQYPGLDEYVKRGYESFNYDFNYTDIDSFLKKLYDRIDSIEHTWYKFGNIKDYKLFEYQLLLFFKNAYKDKKFFDTIQRKIMIDNPYAVQERIKYHYRNCNFSDRELNDAYHDYLKKELLLHFKDICVQYLGYDSLEQFKPNGTEIKIPYLYKKYDFDFLANPRIITSSYPNVNERYYNYLLMDWTVHRLPRYNYNEHTGLYEKSNFNIFYQSENEQKLEQEILSIRKLVPLKKRYQYFR